MPPEFSDSPAVLIRETHLQSYALVRMVHGGNRILATEKLYRKSCPDTVLYFFVQKISRCFSFALAYCKLREFETARRYLEDYLKSDASNLFVAHKLMGDVNELVFIFLRIFY